MKTLLRRRKQAELGISGTGVDTTRGAAVSFLFLQTDNMKILIIGGGGREHAIAWKLRQSARVEKIWCAPGNGGISRDAECVALNVGDVKAAADLAMKLGVDLTIVGPELPLVQGIADEFKQRGLAILGPPKRAAQLEGSKIFAKEFMTRNGIPTAGVYGAFESARAACAKLKSVAWPLVVKADGLCAGKGVLVTSAASDAQEFIERLMNGDEFGDAGKRVLLEEAIAGKELSYIILTDGTNFIPLAPTRDHKRAFDNDEGPNTGGMGTYSTDGMLTRELERQILEEIVRPTLAGLRREEMEYRGFIFFRSEHRRHGNLFDGRNVDARARATNPGRNRSSDTGGIAQRGNGVSRIYFFSIGTPAAWEPIRRTEC